MVSLGEMIAYLPLPGGHITLAERFVNPAMAFTLGWNYCTLFHYIVYNILLNLGNRVQLDTHTSR